MFVNASGEKKINLSDGQILKPSLDRSAASREIRCNRAQYGSFCKHEEWLASSSETGHNRIGNIQTR